MKKIVLILLALCAFHITRAHDFGAVSSGKTIYYSITDATNHYVMVVAPRSFFLPNPYDGFERPSGYIVIPSTVTHDGTTYSVTSIDNDAFKDCTELTGVTIPNSVSTIGNYAFCNCALSSLAIPNSVSTIGNYAFYNCALTSLTISASVTSIGNYAFAECSSLCTLNTPDNPTSLTSIGAYAFYNCSDLTDVTIPYTVVSIGQHAFHNCTSLRSLEITIPGMLTTIGDYAFCNCPLIGNLTLTSAITSIGNYAFAYCSGITGVTLSNNLTTIAKGSFAHCDALTRISFPNSVTTISDSAFFDCYRLKGISFPSSLTSIGNYAFYYCSSLTSLLFPNSVTFIGNYAFNSCNNLKTVYNLSTFPIGTNSYGLSANRVVVPTKSGDGDNAIYQIPDTYSFVDVETNVETEIPRSTIPATNFIYNDNGWKAKEIILTDGQDKFLTPETFTAASATYSREYTNSNRSTLYLPFSASVPEDLEVYDFASFDNNTLSFTEHTGSIAAYTPYLVGYDISAKDGSTTNCTISATNVTFPKSETSNYHPVTSNGMTFQGVIERTQMSSSSNYGYSNGYFVQSGGSAHVNPFRCYFSYSNAPAGAPPMLNVDIVDGEVGIEEAETIDTPNVHFYSTDVYDMMGRIVRRNAENLNGLSHGIYIWKGQKVAHIND